MPTKTKPKTTSYIQYGSTKISVPEKMIGFDKKLQPHLYNTTTPKRHNVSLHNNIPAININIDPNSIRKISRVPFSSQYYNLNTNKLQNNLLIPAPTPPRTAPIPSPIPPPIPSPIPSPIPPPPIQYTPPPQSINIIQAAIRRQQSNIKLAGQEILTNVIGNIVRQDIPQNSIYGNTPIFQEQRAIKTLQAAIRRQQIPKQQEIEKPILHRPPVPIRPVRVPKQNPIITPKVIPTLESINELINPIEANWIIGDAIKNKKARQELETLKQLKQKQQQQNNNIAATIIQQAIRNKQARDIKLDLQLEKSNKQQAALAIQKVFRGSIGRNLATERLAIKSGKTILDAYKNYKAKKELDNKRIEKLIEQSSKVNAVIDIQTAYRQRLARKKLKEQEINLQIINQFQKENAASSIQQAFKKYKEQKQLKNVMGFDFPIGTPDIPIQSTNYNPIIVNTLNRVIPHQSLEKTKIPISVMPNVKPIQRAFRNYKQRKENKLLQEDQQKKAEDAKNFLMKYFKKPSALMTYKELQQNKIRQNAASTIQNVFRQSKANKQFMNDKKNISIIQGGVKRILAVKKLKDNTAYIDYKKDIKSIEQDDLIGEQKILDNIDYENKVITANSGTIGNVLNIFNKKEKDKRKKAIDDAKNAIIKQEQKLIQHKEKIKQKKEKALNLFRNRLTIIRGDNDVDVKQVKEEYAKKLQDIYKEYKQKKEEQKSKKIIKEQLKISKRKKEEEILKQKEQQDIVKKEKEFTDIIDKIIYIKENYDKEPKKLLSNIKLLKELLFQQKNHPLKSQMNKIYGKKFLKIRNKLKQAYELIEEIEKTTAEVKKEQDYESRKKAEEELRILEEKRKIADEKLKKKIETGKELSKIERDQKAKIDKAQKAALEEEQKQKEEELKRILEEEEKTNDKYQKKANDIKKILITLKEAKEKFDKIDKNNVSGREKKLKILETTLEELNQYKQGIKLWEWLPIYEKLDMNEKQLEEIESKYYINILEMKKQIEKASIEKEEKKKIQEKRKQLQEDVKSKIMDIDEKISELYLTKYANDKGIMTAKQRLALYDKIVKLYKDYFIWKGKITPNEFAGIVQQEWEIFDIIKRDYIDTELDEIKKIEETKTIPEYKSKEEVEALSKVKLANFLINVGVLTDEGLIYDNVPPTDTKGRKDIRWAYNAYKRKFN